MQQRQPITRKKKPCKSCGKDSFIFSHGRCRYCTSKDSLKKKSEKNAEQYSKDELFYNEIWHTRTHKCFNCGEGLRIPADTPKNKITFIIRWFVHHLLPKSTHKRYRHISENVILLCRNCHAKAESSISAPKLSRYNDMEKIKKELLGE